ncbi:MAG: MFS transporter [Candidatus Heimdallarchaeum aukensis]|uniref:MFS transporter n=1 Tax=Candidatus Heimdallarchaeum aukensis TaxID=2876573 RepID=A0A9Y1BN87_9ARCH|nr:MAG: MFS transporter [Candidatus Heimdallarchaeum aukensis]
MFYGSCRFGTSIFMNMSSLATVWIYNNHFALNQTWNSIGNAVGKIVIAFSGFLFGYISDILPPNMKLGKRKFFIWTGAPALALSFVMLFIPHLFIPLNNQVAVFSWLLIWNSLFNLFYGYLLTPYQSWMPEITGEDERIEVSALQNSSNLIATIVGLGFTFFIAGYLNEQGGIDSKAGIVLLVSVVVFAVIEIMMFLPTLISIKEKEIKPVERDIVNEIKTVMKNKNYVIWLIGQGIYSIGVTILLSLTLDFIEYIGLSGIVDFAIFGISMFGTVMISFVFWGKLAKKIGKKKSLISGFLYSSLILPLTLVVGKLPFLPVNVQGYIFGFLMGLGLSSIYLFPYAIIADIADKDSKETNEARAGMYTGFNSIPLNIFQALALLLIPLIHDPDNPNSLGLKWLGPIVSLFILLSIPVIMFGDFDPFLKKIEVE